MDHEGSAAIYQMKARIAKANSVSASKLFTNYLQMQYKSAPLGLRSLIVIDVRKPEQPCDTVLENSRNCGSKASLGAAVSVAVPLGWILTKKSFLAKI